MIVESSWVSVVIVKCLWDDKKPVVGLISGRNLSHHLFILIVLVHCDGCLVASYPT
jgi:hypothetical protein